MIRARPAIIFLILATVVGSLGWLFYNSIEFYEETEQSPWSVEAIRNPYLAAEKFLRESGIEVTRTDSLIKLDSLNTISTLLITESGQISLPGQLDSVLSWLKNGGSLIVTANSFSTEDDLLLNEFGVDVDFPRPDDGETNEESPSISEALREYNEKIDRGMTPEEIAQSGFGDISLTEIDFGEKIGKLQIHFDPNRILSHDFIDGSDDQPEHQPFSWSSSDYGVHMIQFEVGEGLLTIISDPGIWQSANIGSYDHAYLLWILTSNRGGFALLNSVRRQTLWKLAYRNGYEALGALGVFIVFLIWYAAQRFGRIMPLEDRNNRALSAHFSATAGYLWHRKAIEALLRPIRQKIIRRAQLAIPGFTQAEPTTQLELIAGHCGIDQQTVQAGFESNRLNQSDFVSTVKLLRKIEQSL